LIQSQRERERAKRDLDMNMRSEGRLIVLKPVLKNDILIFDYY